MGKRTNFRRFAHFNGDFRISGIPVAADAQETFSDKFGQQNLVNLRD